MNNHSQVRDLLALAASGLLDGAEEKIVRDHLRGCAGCAAELAEWQLISQALGRQPAPRLSESLARVTVAQVKAAHFARSEARTRNFFLSAAIAFGWLFSVTTIALLSAVISHFGILNVGGSPLLSAALLSTAFAAVTAGVTAVVLLGIERKLLYVPLA